MKIKHYYNDFMSMHIAEKFAWICLYVIVFGVFGTIINLMVTVANNECITSEWVYISKALLFAIPLVLWPALYCIFYAKR